MKKLLLITLSFICSSYSTQQSNFWTHEEDQKLTDLVSLYDCSPKWIKIAEQIPGRTNKQCRERWIGSLNPNIKKGGWIGGEDQRLTDLVSLYDGSPKWTEISEQIPGRSRKQCEERWTESLDPSVRRGGWTDEEDQKLTDLVSLCNGSPKWTEIAEQISGRTPRQCRSRWNMTSNPNINHSKWTDEEDQLIVRKYNELGSKWAKMKDFFKNRTTNQLKARYFHLVKKGFTEQVTCFSSIDIADSRNLLNDE